MVARLFISQTIYMKNLNFIKKQSGIKRITNLIMLITIFWTLPNFVSAATKALWVGESYTCDVSSSILGLTSDVSWSVNGGYISLSGTGFYRNVKATQYWSGTSTVTCTWKYRLYSGDQWRSQSRSWTFTCNENPVSISPTSMTLSVGETDYVSYSHKYSNSYTSSANVNFTCSDSRIASVSSSGKVTAISPGTTYINVYSNLSSAANAPYCIVHVVEPDNPDEPEPDEPDNPVSDEGIIVDLGLSINWASMNIGANSPEEAGDYFAWGELSPKSNYSEATSKTYYTNIFNIGKLENGVYNLPSSYDAAASWDSSWRMPTSKEIDELIDKCQWEWTSLNGQKGCVVTGPNGNSIFLPAVGCYKNSSKTNTGVGNYWSSSSGNSIMIADGLAFNSIEPWRFTGERYMGCPIRPVTNLEPTGISNTTILDKSFHIENGTIIFNCTTPSRIKIYSISGTLVHESIGNDKVQLPSGIYIVVMDGYRKKVFVN